MFKRILVAVDGSANARRALRATADLAQRYQSEILLLHVIRSFALPRELIEMIKAGEVTASRQEILENSAQIILENAQEELAEADITRVSGTFVTGDPATQIVAHAQENAVDLIVIGHRGLESEAGHTLLGDVARKVANIANTHVLIVR